MYSLALFLLSTICSVNAIRIPQTRRGLGDVGDSRPEAGLDPPLYQDYETHTYIPHPISTPNAMTREDGCLPDDDAVPPKCENYETVTYVPHPFNCSRYWECVPNNEHCLYECPLADEQNHLLYFNPKLNVCDWPENVDCNTTKPCNCAAWQSCVLGSCSPDCKEDTHCNADDYCDFAEGGLGICVSGCRGSSSCGTCGTCINHTCTSPQCCIDSDCTVSASCTNGTCTVECLTDSDCGSGAYCEDNQCEVGCADNSACPGCSTCIDHECSTPECCLDTETEDCTDPSRPICSENNTCIAGCRSSSDCEGWDQVCDSAYSNCNYCDHWTNQCAPGCETSDNCDGFSCSGSICSAGLISIVLDTYTCIGCQGAQGNTLEDGPFIILEGKSGFSCNTRQLDNPDKIDFDNGKRANFSTEDVLQSCYKVDLGLGITEGGVHWTSKQGTWTPNKRQIQIGWSTGESECCCLTVPALTSADPVAALVQCSPCTNHPAC